MLFPLSYGWLQLNDEDSDCLMWVQTVPPCRGQQSIPFREVLRESHKSRQSAFSAFLTMDEPCEDLDSPFLCPWIKNCLLMKSDRKVLNVVRLLSQDMSMSIRCLSRLKFISKTFMCGS